MNKIEINIPEGFEIDNEKSNFSKGIIEFKPVKKKKLSYEDVANALFKGNAYWVGSEGLIREYVPINTKSAPNNATSKKQLECLMAYNKLRNVAEYLNKGWKPDWRDFTQPKHYIYFKHEILGFIVAPKWANQSSAVYFSSSDLAREAISILGEEEIKKALFIY